MLEKRGKRTLFYRRFRERRTRGIIKGVGEKVADVLASHENIRILCDLGRKKGERKGRPSLRNYTGRGAE